MKPILVHLHIYYPHLYDELKNCVLNIKPQQFDLFVTMIEEHEEIISDIKNTFPNAKIEIVENRGYDVGPLIHVLNQVNLDNYDYVVKLHTKSNKPKPCTLLGFDASGDKWRKELLSFMNDWNKTISFIEKRKDIGMVAGANVILKGHNDKEIAVKPKIVELVKALELRQICKKYKFAAGTMFLARSGLFKTIQHKFTSSDFEMADKKGNTLAHAFERVFGIICYANGYEIIDADQKWQQCHNINLLKHCFNQIVRFVYQKKVNHSNCLTVKLLRIPVYRKYLSIGECK